MIDYSMKIYNATISLLMILIYVGPIFTLYYGVHYVLINLRLAKELSVLDGDNIYSMMASEDAVNNLMLHLATSVKEVIC